MAMPRAGRSASVLSSVNFHLLVTTLYIVFHYLYILGLIIRKILGFTDSIDVLVWEVCLLILLVDLVCLRVLSGVWGHLTENEGSILRNLPITGAYIVMTTLCFLEWHTYQEGDGMMFHVILSSVLLVFCCLDGVLIAFTIVQLASDK